MVPVCIDFEVNVVLFCEEWHMMSLAFLHPSWQQNVK